MIEIKDLKKTYCCNGCTKPLFAGFNLTIKRGEKVGLFAQNGTGKTTLINILSGMDKEFIGRVFIKGERISYVHQDPYATLAPWFTCERNILLVREYHHMDIEKGRSFLKKLIEELDINFSLTQYPFMLSGGQRQLVTLLRALILEPDILLMDEPFSALDIKKRNAVIKFLTKYLTDNNLTAIICSHRGDEVKSLLDRAVILECRSTTEISKDIYLSSTNSRQEFERIISEIRFNGERL
jgi:NitT/TauT family transport system ATP-binding protein